MDKILKKVIKNLPRSAGVYLFVNKQGEIIYIGKAVNLAERLKTYLHAPLDPKTRIMVSQVDNVDYIKVFSEFEGLLLEAALIKKYQPKYNVRLKDDKSFLYIAITRGEFPKVLSVRKNDISNPKYLFGPFPSAKTVRQVLRYLRRIFPYCSQKGDRRPCFWSHLGLCSPCPGEIVKLIGEERKIKKKVHLNNIKNLVSVLSGKSKSLTANLTSQMGDAAKQQNYEKAAYIRDQIEKLSWLTRPHVPIFSYLENPDFFEEEQEKELENLQRTLGLHPSIKRIECYDVSNIAGFYASGSMVVFQNGVPSKDDYRRFKIKISGKPNDVAMISEVLRRRLCHSEWDYPNLIIIDGGKGQVSGALKVLNSLKLKIPVVGLAKRIETLILPKLKTDFVEINLPHDSPALNLLKRIRDEAHRFALAYHRKRRSLGFDIK
ncbi:MAG: Uncharacterized protein LiPW16_302 [Microgenomates group bacterium LiPW_16]|nr:MAG: Uncharacterized protein LiPW16_302 [Microgenomates group bacterium LiPW_16]